MNAVDKQVSRLARTQDPRLADGAGARALLDVITSEPVERRSPLRRRLVVGLVAAAAAVAALLLAPGLLRDGTSYANAAVEVHREGDNWVARIKDPFADHALYADAFQAVGVDLTLELVPVSPTAVGRVVTMGGGDEGHSLGSGTEPDGRLRLEVSVGIKGKVFMRVGRPARPDERYYSATDATIAGESLAGLKLEGRSVAEVLPEITARGVKAVYYRMMISKDGGYSLEPVASPGQDWTVWGAESDQVDRVRLLLTREKLTKSPLRE
ncbi:hypothetical protein ACIBG8_51590 [Nonomuraea sp. NPDC050556]|uniref:hypothetical protein n=1 Tax=Nonomuraea sp. NPDC050556 TaxID=3364369 RepID=UPI0037AF2E54